MSRYTGQRPRYDKVKALAIEKTVEHFGFSDSYVRQIIRGDREEESVKRFYNEVYKKLEKALSVKVA